MDFTVEWMFPIGLGILGTMVAFFNCEAKAALVKIKKTNPDRKFFYIPVG